MAKVGYKHGDVDDRPYITYTSDPHGEPVIVTEFAIEATKSIQQGANYTFPVTIDGIGAYDSSVVWSLAVEEGGTIATGTSLTQAGKLTVAAGQATTKALYVTATSAYGQSSMCTVTVTSA